jgi:hypothetical protein
MEINFDELRRDLEGECLAAMYGGIPAMVVELSDVKYASDDELLQIAKRLGVSLGKYTR